MDVDLGKDPQVVQVDEEKRRFFSFYEPANQPDISEANIQRLKGDEVTKYRQVARFFTQNHRCELKFCNQSGRKKMIETEYLIVIHCTHGVNRSGYMIARYLMDRLGVDAAEAIDTVSTVRNKLPSFVPQEAVFDDLLHSSSSLA